MSNTPSLICSFKYYMIPLFFSLYLILLFSTKFRFETVDMAMRLLVPIIVLQNHNRYNILQAGHNYSIDVQAIEREVR